MMCGQPEQGFERNVFDCAGAGRVLGVRIGLPDWNNVLAMPGHHVCTAVAMQPPAGPPQVESDLADRRQPETSYRRAAWGQYGERYLWFESISHRTLQPVRSRNRRPDFPVGLAMASTIPRRLSR